MAYSCRNTPECGYIATCPDCECCSDCCDCYWYCPDCRQEWAFCWCHIPDDEMEPSK